MWESFSNTDSKNHHFLGDISSWFIQELAGLKPNPNVDDISYFEISPKFINELDYAKANYESQFGKVSVMWKRDGQTIKLDATMPEGTHGKAVLPDGYIFENGESTIDLNEGQFKFNICIK